MKSVPEEPVARLCFVLNFAWEIYIGQIISGKIRLQKESSMQLHYASIIKYIGELLCIAPGEIFEIELESSYKGKEIDIICGFNEIKAAIELKCFRKCSNRAVDTDMYDALKDIERLLTYKGFGVRQFICLTDNKYYALGKHTGFSSSVSIKNKTRYKSGVPIIPGWKNRWKDKNRDMDITFSKDINMTWDNSGNLYYLKLYL